MDMDATTNIVVGLMLLVGAFFTLVAAVGLIRLGDLYLRTHAASKAGTLGSGVLLLSAGLFSQELDVLMRALAGVIFFLLTAPVSAHLLARAAYATGYRPTPDTKPDALGERIAAARSAPGDRSAEVVES